MIYISYSPPRKSLMTCIKNTFPRGFYLVALLILSVMPAQLSADTNTRSVVVIDLGLEEASIAKAVGLIESMAVAAPESSSIGLVAASDIVISVIEPMQSKDFLVQLAEQTALLEHSDSRAFPVAIERAMDMFEGNSGKLTLITDGTINTGNTDFDQQFIDWFGLQQEMAAMQDVHLLALAPVQPTTWLTAQISSDFLLQWPSGDSDTASVLARILGVQQVTVAATTDSATSIETTTTSDATSDSDESPTGAETDLTLADKVETEPVDTSQPATSEAVTNASITDTDTNTTTDTQHLSSTAQSTATEQTLATTQLAVAEESGAPTSDAQNGTEPEQTTPASNTETDNTNNVSTELTQAGNETPSRSTDTTATADVIADTTTDALVESTTSNDPVIENSSNAQAQINAPQQNLSHGAGESLLNRIDTQANRLAQLLTNISTRNWLMIAGTLIVLAALILLFRLLRRIPRRKAQPSTTAEHSTTAQHPLANASATSGAGKKGADSNSQDGVTRANPLQQQNKQPEEDNAFSSTALHSLLGDTAEQAQEGQSEKTKMQPLGTNETDPDDDTKTRQVVRQDDQSADSETNEFAIIDKLISKNNKEE
jgi:hypothetical protein